jgi:hypothetical protein
LEVLPRPSRRAYFLNLGATFSAISCFEYGNDAEEFPPGDMFEDSPESTRMLFFESSSSPETKDDPVLMENKEEGSHDHMEDELVETVD